MDFYGMHHLPWWGYVVYTLILTHITMISVTVYLHRHQAHRALDLHPIMAHFFRFWLWMTTGMKTKEWVSVHRKHHAKCETPEDPHSPIVEGLNTVLWEGAELYRVEKKQPETLEKYGHGTPDDFMERRVYSTPFLRGKLGIVLMLLINVACFGAIGLIIWAVQMAWTPFFAAGVINGIGHYFGYRNFECSDASTNVVPWGILIAGEELHNNHHAFARSAKLSLKPWEFDIGWMYIKLMSYVGLAKVKALPPAFEMVPSKEVNLETVRAFIRGRMAILAAYAQDVMTPVCREQTVARSVCRLINRDKSLVNEEGRQVIAQALSEHEHLATVYQFRERLQDIWTRTTATHKELLEALQEWCHQAEQTGIAALRHFVAELKHYRLKEAEAA